MKQFTAVIHAGEPDEGGFWATCVEVPGANGQGETREECLASLASAVGDLLKLNRAEDFRAIQTSPRNFEQLRSATRVSSPALARH